MRVNLLSSFALRWLLPRLSKFGELHPGIEIKVSTTSRKLRYVGTAFDIGIRSGIEHGAGIRSETLMPDRRLPVCNPQILRDRPVEAAQDLRRHVLLHSTTTRSAWSQWFAAAGVSGLVPVRHIELDHVYLQLQAAVDGLGVALGSLPLVEADIAAGRLVCPIAAPDGGLRTINSSSPRTGCAIPRSRLFVAGFSPRQPAPLAGVEPSRQTATGAGVKKTRRGKR